MYVYIYKYIYIHRTDVTESEQTLCFEDPLGDMNQ